LSAPEVFTADFEGTLEYATGVAYSFPGEAPVYLAWGHESDNNATIDDARAVFQRALESGLPWLFQNAKFDVGLLLKQFGLDLWAHAEVHDSMFLMFLADPHALSYNLKKFAAQYVGYPTDDKDDMAAWVWEHKDQIEATTGRKVKRKNGRDADGRVLASNEMEFVPQMPGSLVGRYGKGDIARTNALFEALWGYVIDQGEMGEPYQRELQLLPILMENERIGIRVAQEDLERDLEEFQRAFVFVEDAIRDRLGDPNLNLDADQDFAHALIRNGIVLEDQFERTEKKRDFKVGKDSLKPAMFTDPHVASAIGYRNRLLTAMRNFMEPWAEQARRNGGYVSTNWNQTRGGDGGTRTGRPSTTDPNFLNISKEFEGRPDGYLHPDFLGLPKLPLVRKYMLPDEGGVWAHRDFSGQELRVFAHYEEGALLKAYQANADLDPHMMVAEIAQEVAEFARQYDLKTLRKNYIKVLNFQRIYGGGLRAAAKSLNVSEAEAKQFITMHDQALPGRKILNDTLVGMAKRGQPIRTLGGRVYFAEEPRYVEGKLLTWEYKLLNYLVQGSAADLTKQAIIDWYHHPDRDKLSRFLITVYDEINVSVAKPLIKSQMLLLRDVMNEDRLDCPMRSDAKIGPSWGDAVTVKDEDL
jgi:DNA polymerase I-like protein with 3'-5' exonuclease and polymerase domains